MQHPLLPLCLFVLALSILACGNEPTTATEPAPVATGPDYDAMAREICTCMTPLVALNDEVLRVAGSDDPSAANALLARVDAISADAEACTGRVEAKYGKLNEAQGPAAERAFRTHCPQLARLIESSRTTSETQQ